MCLSILKWEFFLLSTSHTLPCHSRSTPPPAAPPPLFLKLWGTQNIPHDCGGWERKLDSLQSNCIMMEWPTGVLLMQVFTGIDNQIHCVSQSYKHAHAQDSPMCLFTRRVRRNDQRRKRQEEKKYSCPLGQATGPKHCCAELGKSLHRATGTIVCWCWTNCSEPAVSELWSQCTFCSPTWNHFPYKCHTGANSSQSWKAFGD